MDHSAKDDVQSLQWWTVREVANRWKLSLDVVYSLVTEKPEAGKLLARKFGGSWRIHTSALAEYEAAGIPKQRREAEKFRTVPDALGRRAKSAV